MVVKVDGDDNVVDAHFHCAAVGANGGVTVSLLPALDGEVTLTNADIIPTGFGGCTIQNLVGLAFAMRDGLIYANIHTFENLAGEVRGQMLED